MKKKLVAFLRKEKLLSSARPSPQQVLEALLRFLAKSPAETVFVNLEDLWGEERSQNVPGTCSERPNWRRKASRTIEDIVSDPVLLRLLGSLRRQVRSL
jgi:4-alpha-glucanotransferase